MSLCYCAVFEYPVIFVYWKGLSDNNPLRSSFSWICIFVIFTIWVNPVQSLQIQHVLTKKIIFNRKFSSILSQWSILMWYHLKDNFLLMLMVLVTQKRKIFTKIISGYQNLRLNWISFFRKKPKLESKYYDKKNMLISRRFWTWVK